MLFQTIDINPTTKVYLWKITETFDELFRVVKLRDVSLARLEKMKSEEHQKGFLAVRMILQHLDLDDFKLFYDESGKPHLLDCPLKEISISHSHEFSAVAISEKPIGLDLEKIKEKTLRIAPRFMDVSHLENLSNEEKILKATVIWGIKESIFKIKNQPGISFPQHISETAFHLADQKTTAQLNFQNQKENFQIVFNRAEDYIFVCAFSV
ncbi:4'-phosphopantetheinyl transferase superfamily protein [Flavobacterium sp. NST-5]|uniref:4'-phosphopantetheinyl transferase superfamily protein n=1 Tax=Flavobacterium ichthyis TaxID=2698827 RepID=A0ABW9Z9N8_9FLAO|nr:4'-phosphopantetheinyl transferase superfamily protein [Flavobacterium ichthyis]NBL63795.1 4'-phosphopantetheinyl transferase superfamily protein [Flavobacterium ichthyis]